MSDTQKLIVIEGLDGSGKATQAQLLYSNLVLKHKRVRKVSFPDYDSPSSALVKMYLNGEFGEQPDDVNAYAASSFYAVDRYASFKKNWKEDWEKGIIIADRYTTSNAIHQCSKLPRQEWNRYLDWLFEYEYRLLGIPCPSLILYLKVDPSVSQQLLSVRYDGDEKKKDVHEKNYAYMLKCREAADYCADQLGWTVIECVQNDRLRAVSDIASDIQSRITGKLFES